MIPNILIIEDILSHYQLLNLMLKFTGVPFHHLNARSFQHAQFLLNTISFDFVFLDLRLPGGSGYDLIQYTEPECPIFIYSAESPNIVRLRSYNRNIEIIGKPIPNYKVVQAILKTNTQTPA